jgi:transcriptional regulator with XRE-family HTH domain
MIEQFLREIRKEGIKQKDIEARTGLTQSYISKLSRGATPSIETVILLADTFHVSTDKILGRVQGEL